MRRGGERRERVWEKLLVRFIPAVTVGGWKTMYLFTVQLRGKVTNSRE